jgi:hypothetical protein
VIWLRPVPMRVISDPMTAEVGNEILTLAPAI